MITAIIPKLPYIHKQQTIDFYTTHLGFELSNDYGNYVLMHQNQVELHFFAYPTLNPATTDCMVYIRVSDNIEKLYAKVASGKVPQLHTLETKPWGQKEFSLVDPNGTLLTFGQAL
jgi:catechol 2,3-dioxygenase-like lactoylglutathione lyase family enzyme